MRKLRFVSALTACALVLGTAVMPELVMKPLLTVGAEETEEVTEYTYGALTYTTDGTSVTITGCEAEVTEVEVPIEIDGLPVTLVETDALHDSYNLENIAVEEGHPYYTSIDGALYNKDVTEILCWPRNKNADVIIPEGVQIIGERAFYCCFIKSVTFPDTLTTISRSAFNTCEIRDDIVIPDSVTTIGDYAFSNAGYSFGLGITLPSTLTSIGEGVFSGSGLGKIVIPEGVTSIGDGAFYMCEYLNRVTLPDSLEVIGDEVFMDCWYLYSVNFPDSITTIGDYAFAYTRIGGNIQLPENLTSIGDHAFDSAITSITVSTNLTSIGENAFSKNLTQIFYSGTRDEWNAISIHENNPYILSAALYCSYIPNVTTLGELNGDQAIDALDAALLLQASAAAGTNGDSGLTEEQLIEADVNGDGTFDANDAACILQYSAYIGAGGTGSIENFLS